MNNFESIVEINFKMYYIYLSFCCIHDLLSILRVVIYYKEFYFYNLFLVNEKATYPFDKQIVTKLF